jgi:hypothetical protein
MTEFDLTKCANSFINLMRSAEENALRTDADDSDFYRNELEKLKGFLSYKFAGRTELTQIQKNPDTLKNLFLQEAMRDENFEEELAGFMMELQCAYDMHFGTWLLTCLACEGWGVIGGKTCRSCRGRGVA